MTRMLLSLVLLTLAQGMTAQSFITLTGRVMADHQTPLSFASIGVSHAPIGTVTNADGEFEFHIPVRYAGDTLVVSFIGFTSFTGRIDSLSKLSPGLIIRLRAYSHMLREVIVRAPTLSAKELVAQAVRRMRDNYPTTLFRVDGFFREIEAENDHYTLLTEAALSLEDDFAKLRNSFGETIILHELRRSYRYSKSPRPNRLSASLRDLLENNDVRYTRGMLNVRINTYQYDSTTTYDGRPVYVIRTTNRDDEGRLYIDVETLGFLRIEALRKSRRDNVPYYEVYPASDSLHIGRRTFSFSVDFQSYNGKLYLKHMQEQETEEFYNPITKTIHTTFNESLEFIVTQIHPGISQRDGLVLNRQTEFTPGPYRVDFWRNYNVAKLSPLSESLIRDLEKEVSLQQQFEASKP